MLSHSPHRYNPCSRGEPSSSYNISSFRQNKPPYRSHSKPRSERYRCQPNSNANSNSNYTNQPTNNSFHHCNSLSHIPHPTEFKFEINMDHPSLSPLSTPAHTSTPPKGNSQLQCYYSLPMF